VSWVTGYYRFMKFYRRKSSNRTFNFFIKPARSQRRPPPKANDAFPSYFRFPPLFRIFQSVGKKCKLFPPKCVFHPPKLLMTSFSHWPWANSGNYPRNQFGYRLWPQQRNKREILGNILHCPQPGSATDVALHPNVWIRYCSWQKQGFSFTILFVTQEKIMLDHDA